MTEKVKTEKHDSSESIRTTATMRAKAKAITRCLISMMKIFRLCGCGKKMQKKAQKKQEKT
jgi:hypothetical protein